MPPTWDGQCGGPSIGTGSHYARTGRAYRQAPRDRTPPGKDGRQSEPRRAGAVDRCPGGIRAPSRRARQREKQVRLPGRAVWSRIDSQRRKEPQDQRRALAMDRTYVVTGAASGIGAATASYLRGRGGRVIACDLRNADVVADLTTSEGRAELVEGVTRLSGGRIDAIVANAGGGPPQTSLSLNFFGAVATLGGLRRLLATSPAPRAVAVSSIASFSPVDSRLVEACLSMDEHAAIAAGYEFAARNGPLDAMKADQVAKLA